MKQSPLNVLAFADEPVLQIGLQAVLAGVPGFRLGGCYASVSQLAGASQQFQPELILYSLSLDPELAQLSAVRRAAPDAAIILWSREFSTELAHQALDLGIQGFLSTTAGAET